MAIQTVAVIQLRREAIHIALVPAGVDHIEAIEGLPQRKRQEPVDDFLVAPRLPFQLRQEGLVLLEVLLGMSAERLAVLVAQVPSNRIELMIAHDRVCVPFIHHSTHDVDGVQLAGAAIDEVTKENYLAFRVPPCACLPLIAKVRQERFEFIGMPMNVADYIVSSVRHAFLTVRGFLHSSW